MQWSFRSILLLAALAMLAGACAMPAPPGSPAGYYYLTSDMTYMRDAGAYNANVVGQLYKGERVEKLEDSGAGWWRVHSGRSGLYGWVAGKLFSPVPVPVPHLLVTQTVNLRECPRIYCPSLQMLSRGDRVQKVEQNDQGWVRVLVVKSRNLGWLPAKALSESLEQPLAKKTAPAYLFVAVRGLKLRQQPLVTAEVIKPLQFNDQVEKLDENHEGWIEVRQPASGAVGWVQARYLEIQPRKSPRFWGKPRRKKPQPSKPLQPAESAPTPEPEIM
jgi:uncharacterized protein YgiM (DUF1202 family)